jgi:hypothetical protein
MRARPRLDSNHVRAYQPGEAAIIEGGRVEHVRIIRTNPAAEVIQRANELVTIAHLAPGPTDATLLEDAANPTPGLEPGDGDLK